MTTRRMFFVLIVMMAPMAPFAVESSGAQEKPLRVHIISGCREYTSNDSLTSWSRRLEARYPVRFTASMAEDKATTLPGLSGLDDADVMVVFARRLEIRGDQLAKVKNFIASGKPVIGIRTASHAFQNYLEFDKEVLGGDYQNHGDGEKEVKIAIPLVAADHPVLRGIKPWTREGKIYRNPHPADDITVLLTCQGAKESAPVAWVRERAGGQRVFYTSMGLPSDFETRPFNRLLTNALRWVSRKDLKPAR